MLYVNKFVVNRRSKLSFSVKTPPSYDAARAVLKLMQLKQYYCINAASPSYG